MSTIDELNKRCALPTTATSTATICAGSGDLPMVVIKNAHATAHIYLLGAHITHFQPHGAQPVLWLSQQSRFHIDAPIRGGVPICWPWFGAHDNIASAPGHGFARTCQWTLAALRAESDGSTTVEFTLQDNDATRKIWPHQFQLTYTIHIGQRLELQLTTTNKGTTSFAYAEALHTYLTVGDINTIRITGLQGVNYLDKVDDMRQHVEADPITIGRETDRVYLHTTATCTVFDESAQRSLSIAKEGSQTTVVWNPWIAKSAAMPDFGDNEWRTMVCVESANAFANSRVLAPGTRHTLRATIAVQTP
jgi:D-hexose-6-phosphate mutarotase